MQAVRMKAIGPRLRFADADEADASTVRCAATRVKSPALPASLQPQSEQGRNDPKPATDSQEPVRSAASSVEPGTAASAARHLPPPVQPATQSPDLMAAPAATEPQNTAGCSVMGSPEASEVNRAEARHAIAPKEPEPQLPSPPNSGDPAAFILESMRHSASSTAPDAATVGVTRRDGTTVSMSLEESQVQAKRDPLTPVRTPPVLSPNEMRQMLEDLRERTQRVQDKITADDETTELMASLRKRLDNHISAFSGSSSLNSANKEAVIEPKIVASRQATPVEALGSPNKPSANGSPISVQPQQQLQQLPEIQRPFPHDSSTEHRPTQLHQGHQQPPVDHLRPQMQQHQQGYAIPYPFATSPPYPSGYTVPDGSPIYAQYYSPPPATGHWAYGAIALAPSAQATSPQQGPIQAGHLGPLPQQTSRLPPIDGAWSAYGNVSPGIVSPIWQAGMKPANMMAPVPQAGMQLRPVLPLDSNTLMDPLPPRRKRVRVRDTAAENTQCQQCGTRVTPEWRRGPNGLRTLCNACGLYHAKIVRKKGEAEAARLLRERPR